MPKHAPTFIRTVTLYELYWHNVWLTTQIKLKHLPNHAPKPGQLSEHKPNHAPTPGQWTNLRTFAETDSNVHWNPHYWNSRSRLGLTHCTDFAVTTGFEFFLIWGGELCWWVSPHLLLDGRSLAVYQMEWTACTQYLGDARFSANMPSLWMSGGCQSAA